MIELRRKILIPSFRLTEVCEVDDPLAIKREIRGGKGREALTYYCRPVVEPHSESRFNYNLFPIPLDRAGRPWGLATNFLLSRLEGESRPNMVTYHSLADDLGAFKEWLDQSDRPDELLFDFPKMKLRRCTYRYNGFLKQQMFAGEVAQGTAKRRMSTVIAFYRWLIQEEVFEPENEPWEERGYSLTFKGEYGAVIFKKGLTTDVGIKVAKAEDALEDTIQDGGKLRPLPKDEQQWVMEALNALGNPEMYLICLLMIATGARVQTATTLRVKHLTGKSPVFSNALSGGGSVFKLKCGPGTGIDTKGDKQGLLQIPLPLYQALQTYVLSARATRRREAAIGGVSGEQYLFLTQQGSPYYQAKDEAVQFDPEFKERYRKAGGTIRQFLADRLIPHVRKNHDPKFHFRIHDLRATFGMNHTDIQMDLVDSGKVSLSQARNIVRQLMWHKNSATTDLYLDYRRRLEQVYAAINGYGEQVQTWIDQAMTGVLDD
ncbi:site-specific integrase [Rhodoferax sp. TS-BS-61-7]|uniref:tyrosine-type recombinase/integrase n=1 Tax=Rhodoferax sp. TS-BS-61-7 TaxID=2094194 RepID=UPI000CF6C2F3|nr:site-specific integrase [Rhodoferax sp. TS-BS-61-7]PQA77531.1 integrase [Rhodoferax sp. TS-BS-61-7]